MEKGNKEEIIEAKAEAKHSKKAFNQLIRMAKRKNALLELEINGKIIFKS